MSAWTPDSSRLSLANAEADWDGITLRGLQNLEIDEKAEGEGVYGNGSVALGSTDGKHSATLKFSTIPEEADSAVKALGAGFYKRLGTVGITMTNSVTFDNYTVELSRVKIKSMNMKLGEAGGQKPSLVDFECDVYDPVNWNGVRGFDLPSAGGLGLSLGFGLTL